MPGVRILPPRTTRRPAPAHRRPRRWRAAPPARVLPVLLLPVLLLPVLLLPLLALAAGCTDAGADSGGTAAGESALAPLAVERGDLERSVLLTGELRAQRAVDLIVPAMPSWQVQLSWMVDDGSQVSQGEPVLEFDSSQFTSDLEEKRLALREKENELDRLRARGQVTEAEKRYEIDRREVELEKARTRADVPADLMAEREYQELQLALETARMDLDKARRDLEAAEADQRAEIEMKRIEMEDARREIEQAERAVESMTLTAPEDGIFVVQDHMWEPRKVQVGDMVHRGYTVARLPDLSTMEVRATLFDVDDGRVEPGMEGRCVLDAYPDRTFPCHVVSVSPVARESGRNSLLRYFEVTLVLDEDDPDVMRPGMSVKAEVVTDRLEDVLLAPRAALDEAAAGASGEGVRARLPSGEWADVRLGACGVHRCVVESGLEEGTKLARAPFRPPAEGATALADAVPETIPDAGALEAVEEGAPSPDAAVPGEDRRRPERRGGAAPPAGAQLPSETPEEEAE